MFFIVSLFVYGGKSPEAVQRKPALRDYFQDVAGHTATRQIPLNDEAVAMLKLDDYAFIDYQGEAPQKVTLYIGYYYTANKAYASHSPLICYPSQGWLIDNKPARRTLAVGEHAINYETIITSNGDHKELVFYWYQAHARTSNEIYRNKIDMAYNRLMGKNDQYAFVRVSVPISGSDPAGAEQAGLAFMRAFLPQFIEYFAAT